MEAIKIFGAFLLGGCLVALAYFFLALCFSKSTHAEPIQDCIFVPTQASPVTIYCGSLKGEGSVGIRICGINYTVDVKCS